MQKMDVPLPKLFCLWQQVPKEQGDVVSTEGNVGTGTLSINRNSRFRRGLSRLGTFSTPSGVEDGDEEENAEKFEEQSEQRNHRIIQRNADVGKCA